jgi:hypothetical protein
VVLRALIQSYLRVDALPSDALSTMASESEIKELAETYFTLTASHSVA